MMALCTRCDLPARHEMAVGAETVAVVCCVHADEVMAVAGATVPLGEAVEGWSRWVEAHRGMCGGEGE